MTPGKRGRPNFSFRTAVTTARVTFDFGISEPPPAAAAAMGGIEFSNRYNYHLPSPRYSGKNVSSVVETADFLSSCGRCHRRLSPGRDIYMYRGDAAFCSQECREQQMNQDERKERRAGMAKNGESPSPEVAAAAAGAKTLAAA